MADCSRQRGQHRGRRVRGRNTPGKRRSDQHRDASGDRQQQVPCQPGRVDALEVGRQQQRERRKHRQDVRRQFRPRDAEEGEHEHRPDQQQAQRLEPVLRVAARAQSRQRWQQRRPWQEADQQERHEVPQRAGAPCRVGQVALQVLVDEEEFEETGVLQRHRDEPGRRQRQVQRQARAPVHAAPHRPLAVQHAVEQQRGAGYQQADQALGQGGAGHRRPGRPHRVALCGRSGVVALREQEAAQREREEQGEPHVEAQEVTVQYHPRGRGQRHRRMRGRSRTPQAPRGERHRRDREESGQRRPQAGGECVDAEQVVARRAHPVLQRRLLEVEKTVQARRDPVAAAHHLQRDRRVASLVGAEQRAFAERPEPGEREQAPAERLSHCPGAERVGECGPAGFSARGGRCGHRSTCRRFPRRPARRPRNARAAT